MIKIAICDDEILTANKTADLIEDYLRGRELEYSINVLDKPSILFEDKGCYDILFLDIEMSEFNGIDLAKQAKEKNPKTIIFFITNYENYLDDAFDVNAFRYMRKPVDIPRLHRGIDLAVSQIQKGGRQIILHALNKAVALNIEDIIFITIENRKCRVVTTLGDKLVDDRLKDIYKLLPDNIFAYSHKSYLINLSFVADFDCKRIVLKHKQNKYTAYASRRMYPEFKKKFMLYARGVL